MNSLIICLSCGSTKEDENGFCINNHDNWLEPKDELERFEEAVKKFGSSLKEIRYAMENKKDLKIK
jgi:hypothetical protein